MTGLVIPADAHTQNLDDKSVTIFADDLVTDSDIVPDDLQAELITWRDVFLGGAFRIGDIANELIERQRYDVDGTGMRITGKRIYKAVGRFCGKSGRTIRYYAETASFFPVDVRQKYQVVPFSHFVLAKSYGNWQDVLDYVLDHPDCTADALMREFSQDYLTSSEGADAGGVYLEPGYEGDNHVELFGAGGFDSAESGESSQIIPGRQSLVSQIGDLAVAIDRFDRFVSRYPDQSDDLRDVIKYCRMVKGALANIVQQGIIET